MSFQVRRTQIFHFIFTLLNGYIIKLVFLGKSIDILLHVQFSIVVHHSIHIGVFPKLNADSVNSASSEESDKSLKHELGSV